MAYMQSAIDRTTKPRLRLVFGVMVKKVAFQPFNSTLQFARKQIHV